MFKVNEGYAKGFYRKNTKKVKPTKILPTFTVRNIWPML